MSGDPMAVLVVPAEGDPGGLLARGVCGSTPARVVLLPRGELLPLACHGLVAVYSPAPTGQSDSMWLCPACQREVPRWEARQREWVSTGMRYDDAPLALPLWWDGALVPEGWDRARRVLLAATDGAPTITFPRLSTAIAVGHRLTGCARVSRVVLLDRVDGRLVERAP